MKLVEALCLWVTDLFLGYAVTRRGFFICGAPLLRSPELGPGSCLVTGRLQTCFSGSDQKNSSMLVRVVE